jgi:hypothetical protein
MKRAIYHRRVQPSMKPALQITTLVLLYSLLPILADTVAQSDLLVPLALWTGLSAITALVIFAWPVKR